MGICLDTEANTTQEMDEMSTEWKGGGNGDGQRSGDRRGTPASGTLPMQNLGKVKFDPPKVPVIFVLGGPGSGKVTHCDTLMQEKRGVTHINMMDLLQQYAMGNDMQDFSKLSSKTVTEVLMLEMKMAPAAKAYLVSGYPRSMRDVVEYSEKIQVVNGVILISWRQAVLQKQIDYGAKLGHVVLSLAKMELENFFKNVMPVADYFDQSDMLVAVNGERSPSDVYKDFRTGVLDILNAQENQEALLNGVAGMGRGIDDIPGSIVSVDTAPSQKKVIAVPSDRQVQTPNRAEIMEVNSVMGQNIRRTSGRNLVQQVQPNQPLKATPPTTKVQTNKCPPVVWVIGGPGSNKAALCLKAVGYHSNWGHISIGRLLRTIADSGPKPLSENYSVKEALTEGEMAPKSAVDKILSDNLLRLNDKKCIIIDGYPRDLSQIQEFEKKYGQKPPIILLDCSKLQLGRGRLDDTVSSFRRRLELFRELTLPMLKQMDTSGRLSIVDGDTDSPSVQREFEKIIRQCVEKLMNGGGDDKNDQSTVAVTGNNNFSDNKNSNNNNNNSHNSQTIKLLSNHNTLLHNINDAVVQDLEEIPNPVPTVSHHVSLTNGHLRNSGIKAKISTPNHHIGNNVANNIGAANHIGNNIANNVKDGWPKVKGGGGQQNGHIPNGRPNFRNMLEEADNFHIDSHM